MIASSSSFHSCLSTAGLRWLSQRSRACLPLRSSPSFFASWPHLPVPSSFTSATSLASSSAVQLTLTTAAFSAARDEDAASPTGRLSTPSAAAACGASFGVAGVSVSGELGRSSFGSWSAGGTALSIGGVADPQLVERKSEPASTKPVRGTPSRRCFSAASSSQLRRSGDRAATERRQDRLAVAPGEECGSVSHVSLRAGVVVV